MNNNNNNNNFQLDHSERHQGRRSYVEFFPGLYMLPDSENEKQIM